MIQNVSSPTTSPTLPTRSRILSKMQSPTDDPMGNPTSAGNGPDRRHRASIVIFVDGGRNPGRRPPVRTVFISGFGCSHHSASSSSVWRVGNTPSDIVATVPAVVVRPSLDRQVCPNQLHGRDVGVGAEDTSGAKYSRQLSQLYRTTLRENEDQYYRSSRIVSAEVSQNRILRPNNQRKAFIRMYGASRHWRIRTL